MTLLDSKLSSHRIFGRVVELTWGVPQSEWNLCSEKFTLLIFGLKTSNRGGVRMKSWVWKAVGFAKVKNYCHVLHFTEVVAFDLEDMVQWLKCACDEIFSTSRWFKNIWFFPVVLNVKIRETKRSHSSLNKRFVTGSEFWKALAVEIQGRELDLPLQVQRIRFQNRPLKQRDSSKMQEPSKGEYFYR